MLIRQTPSAELEFYPRRFGKSETNPAPPPAVQNKLTLPGRAFWKKKLKKRDGCWNCGRGLGINALFEMNKAALIIIALTALAAVAFFAINRKPNTQIKLGSEKQSDDFPPKPKWKPNLPVDIEKTVQTFAYYSDKKKTFVVFENGTCVLIPDGSSAPENAAKEVLNKVYNYHPDFNPQTMDDGNFMISYSQPAYSIVFRSEFEKNRDYIKLNHLDGLVRAEVLLNEKHEPNKFDDIGKIGLFARARMFLDAQNPVVVKIWKPVE